jgi:hypothetical protein
MKATGYDVRETASMRGKVLDVFPTPPGLPSDKSAYLHSVDQIYQSDAYHSLSIEGSSVSAGLIERVRSGNWDHDNHDADRQSRDALAARGYWQAFQSVKKAIDAILRGMNPGALVRAAHHD